MVCREASAYLLLLATVFLFVERVALVGFVHSASHEAGNIYPLLLSNVFAVAAAPVAAITLIAHISITRARVRVVRIAAIFLYVLLIICECAVLARLLFIDELFRLDSGMSEFFSGALMAFFQLLGIVLLTVLAIFVRDGNKAISVRNSA